MKLVGKKRYHRRRAAEEGVRAKVANNQEARDAHARLAKYHSRVASDPDFVPFEKASRHGQAGSYWAAAHLSNKVATEEENVVAADGAARRLENSQLLPQALGSRNGPAVAQLLRDIFPTVDDDTLLLPDNGNIGPPSPLKPNEPSVEVAEANRAVDGKP